MGVVQNFSETLKEEIQNKLGAFLNNAAEFFDNNKTYSKYFTVYIHETEPLNSFKNKHYFVIELDNHTLLDLQCDYNPKTNEITNPCLRGNLPYHETWDSYHFDKVKLSGEEKKFFLTKQEEVTKQFEDINIPFVIDILEFNPDADCLPESLIEFVNRNNKSIEEVLQDKELIHQLFTIYYNYNKEISDKFESLVDVD